MLEYLATTGNLWCLWMECGKVNEAQSDIFLRGVLTSLKATKKFKLTPSDIQGKFNEKHLQPLWKPSGVK